MVKKDGIIKKKQTRNTIIKNIHNIIKAEIDKNPFITSIELSKYVYKQLGMQVSNTTCWRSIKYNNYSFKRAKIHVSTPKNNKENINLFRDEYLNSKNIISIDESFFYMIDRPKYGYSKKGKALKTNVFNNPKKKKVTLYMAISENKIVGFKITIQHGNSIDFLQFLKTLNLQNNTLLMDNVAFHKTKIVKEYVNTTNSKILFVPPYSPDYNPIELAFSKIKNYYRYNNDDNMISNIIKSIYTISSNDLNNYFRHINKILSI